MLIDYALTVFMILATGAVVLECLYTGQGGTTKARTSHTEVIPPEWLSVALRCLTESAMAISLNHRDVRPLETKTWLVIPNCYYRVLSIHKTGKHHR